MFNSVRSGWRIRSESDAPQNGGSREEAEGRAAEEFDAMSSRFQSSLATSILAKTSDEKSSNQQSVTSDAGDDLDQLSIHSSKSGNVEREEREHAFRLMEEAVAERDFRIEQLEAELLHLRGQNAVLKEQLVATSAALKAEETANSKSQLEIEFRKSHCFERSAERFQSGTLWRHLHVHRACNARLQQQLKTANEEFARERRSVVAFGKELVRHKEKITRLEMVLSSVRRILFADVCRQQRLSTPNQLLRLMDALQNPESSRMSADYDILNMEIPNQPEDLSLSTRLRAQDAYPTIPGGPLPRQVSDAERERVRRELKRAASADNGPSSGRQESDEEDSPRPMPGVSVYSLGRLIYDANDPHDQSKHHATDGSHQILSSRGLQHPPETGLQPDTDLGHWGFLNPSFTFRNLERSLNEPEFETYLSGGSSQKVRRHFS